MNRAYQFPAADYRKWRQHLDTQGYVVILDVLTPAEVHTAVTLFVQRCFPGTYNGFVDEHIHSDFLWYCRTRPGLLEVYRRIYQTHDIITSFDRFTAIAGDAPQGDEDYWLHVDYPLFTTKPPLPQSVYQSFVSLTEPCGAGFRVVPTNKFSPDLLKRENLYPEPDAEATYFQLAPSYVDKLDDAGLPRKIESPAGSLTLWNSHTIHDNTSLVTPAKDVWLRRLVTYQCFVPRSWASDEDMRRRLDAFHKGQQTTHWPALHLDVVGEGGERAWNYKEMMRKYPTIAELL